MITLRKLSDFISDTSKFKKLSPDPTLLRKGQLQRFLRKLKNKQFFTKEVYDKIYPSGSQSASIYGLPNIHKFNDKETTYLCVLSYLLSAPITTISLSSLLIC